MTFVHYALLRRHNNNKHESNDGICPILTFRPINYTVGIGVSRLNIFLVQKDSGKVVRTYRVTIYRPSLDELTAQIPLNDDLNVCQLIQVRALTSF